MQEISPVTPNDFLSPTKELLYKFEVYDGASWIDLCDFGGKNYLVDKSLRVNAAGPGATPEPIAGTWSADILNKDGIFDPFHPSSAYAGLFRIGRKVRISVGGVIGGTPYYWQRLIGYMDAPEVDDESRIIKLSGMDFMKRLADTKLYAPENYWGDVATFDSVASFTETGSQLYIYGDALDPVNETDAIDASWTTNDAHSLFVSVDDGGGVYYGKYSEDDGGSGWVMNANVGGALTKDGRYIFKVKYRTPLAGDFKFELAQTIGGNRQVLSAWSAASTAGFITEIRFFKAAGSVALEFKVIGSGLGICYMEIDWVWFKAGLPDWNNYDMPEDCNGPHYVTLDGVAVGYGDPVAKDGTGGGYYYDEGARIFYFDEDKAVEAGDANLLVYYYQTAAVEDVVADLLVRAGLYADQAAALAAMDYTPTETEVDRVWFDSGSSALDAARLLCGRVNYRFWFAYDGTPCFKPAPAAGTPVFEFSSFGHIKSPRRRQDIGQIRNRVVVEGAERAMFKPREDKDRSRWTGSDFDQDSIDAYLEHTEPISNHLFQDQESVDDIAAAVLGERKDPKWYIDLRLAGNPAPLELGDTISMVIYLDLAPTLMVVTALIRDITIEGSSINYTCEVVDWGGGEPVGAHVLLDGNAHYDTVLGEAEPGSLIMGDGNPEIPLGSPDPDQHALLNGDTHPDTESQEPELGGLIMGIDSEPVKWTKLAPGEPGRMLEMGTMVPAWGRKIYSEDDPPEPEEGVDGDIWLEY